MSKLSDFLDDLVAAGGTLARDELIALLKTAKKDKSDFVRLQAENLERWTLMLAEGDLSADGYRKLVRNMEVVAHLEVIKLKVQAQASAQRLAKGIQDLVIGQLFKLI
ncbi:MAG TPA: hypothetical protein VG817_00705 [Gemmatimonadales bacterium]|nr:hypothetical protein [Gemmatimonadales bacterium]